jgi:hypothetical protein
MRRRPARMASVNAPNRVNSLVYDYDWLANQSRMEDDAGVFYERSAGRLSSGSDDPNFSFWDPALRPSALYISTNIRSSAGATYNAGVPRGGYVTLDYGESGNVTQMIVHSQCVDVSNARVTAA